MQSMIQQGNLGRYSAVFTTYSQLQTVGKKGNRFDETFSVKWPPMPS